MNPNQMADFLTKCTTPGFRRSLRRAPQYTLLQCGFSQTEASKIALALPNGRKPTSTSGRHEPSTDTNPLQTVSFTYQKINNEWLASGVSSQSDDWS